jgi:GGDEF domain-containing protein
MLPMPNESQFLRDVDALIGEPRADLQIAILVIDTATPNQYEELARTLGQDGVDLCQDTSTTWISKCLPAHTELYSLAAARFGCVLQVDTPDDFEETLDRFAYKVRTPEPTVRSTSIAISVGIGVAYYPHHGAGAAELLRAATSGIHESLESGKPWCPYSPVFDRASCRAAQLLHDVGPALTGGQFHLVYQPKTDLLTGRCMGAEAMR